MAEIFNHKGLVQVPQVLSRNEVKRILLMAASLKARAVLSLAYHIGMRAGEDVRLRATDFGSDRMLIRVENPSRAIRFANALPVNGQGRQLPQAGVVSSKSPRQQVQP